MAGRYFHAANLVRRFGRRTVVDDVSIGVEQGEFHAIIGPNGAGKTTVFNLLGGNLKTNSGQIYFKGEPITRLAAHDRCRIGIGRTFQINNIYRKSTVFRNIQLPMLARHGLSWTMLRSAESFLWDEVQDLADRTGLGDKLGSIAAELPYGDCRRLELAIALAGNPQLLLLDEPTSGMAVSERPALIQLVQKLVSTGNMTVILIEHDMDIVFSVADKITVLHQGRVVAEGDPDNIAAHPEVRKVYLGEQGRG